MIEDIVVRGKTVGYYTFVDGGKLFIDDIQIDPEFQKKGICTQLLLDLLEIYKKITLVNVKNLAAFERIVEKITLKNGYSANIDPLYKDIVLYHTDFSH